LFEVPDRGQLSGAVGAVSDDSTAFNLVSQVEWGRSDGVKMCLRFVRPMPLECFAKKVLRQVASWIASAAYDFQFAKLALDIRVQFQQLSI
jgi:hypothetical protein